MNETTATSAAPLRVGVLGCGMISGNHFAAWARCQGAEVVAVCDPMLDRAQARAAEFGIAAAYDSPEAMMAAESLDLIDIITPIPPSADFAASFQPDALPQ